MGLRSGLWLGDSRTFRLRVLNPLQVVCIIVQVTFKDLSIYSCILPSILTHLLIPAAEKHLHAATTLLHHRDAISQKYLVLPKSYF